MKWMVANKKKLKIKTWFYVVNYFILPQTIVIVNLYELVILVILGQSNMSYQARNSALKVSKSLISNQYSRITPLL